MRGNKTDLKNDFSNVFRISYGVACALLIVIGTFGNIVIPLIVKRNKRLRNRTYFWLVNLSVADLLICSVCLPITFTNTVVSLDWVLGEVGCKITSYIIHVSFSVSALTLLAISWDRFLAVVFPLKLSSLTAGETGRTTYAILAAIWIFASATMTPIANVHSVKIKLNSDGKTSKICKDSWSNPDFEKYYWVFLFVCYGLVIILMIILYCAIGNVLFSRKIIAEEITITSNRRLAHLRSRTKTIKMLCIIVVLFIVLWSPYFVLKILKVLKSDKNTKISSKAFAATSMLGIINSLCNFVIYAAMNKVFRDGVKKLFTRRKKVFPIPLQNVGL